jgi:hypothetical protein
MNSTLAEIIDMINGHPGFVVSDDSVDYVAMSRVIFGIYTKSDGIHMIWGKDIQDVEQIKQTVRDYLAIPPITRIHHVFVDDFCVYYLSPGALVSRVDGTYKITRPFDQFTFNGEQIEYDYSSAIAKFGSNQRSELLNILLREIDGHPDLTITAQGVCLIIAGAFIPNAMYIISVQMGGKMSIFDIFRKKPHDEPSCESLTDLDGAIDYIRRLKLAFSPTLSSSKFIRNFDGNIKYPHLMIHNRRLVARGELYKSGNDMIPYTCDDPNA